MSDQPQQQKSSWITKAQRVIGTLLYDREDWFAKAVYGTGLKVTDMPDTEYFRLTLQTMLEIKQEKVVIITPENIWTYSGKQVPVEWCQEMQGYHNVDLLELVSDAKLCIRLGERAQRYTVTVAAATNYLDETKDEREITRRLVHDLSIERAVEVRSAKSGAIIDRIREEITKGVQTQVTPTGILWLDAELKGGLRSRRYMALGAREKGRKSTMLRNILLGASRQFVGWKRQADMRMVPLYGPRENVSIALLAYENDQQITTWDFVSMLAYEYLHYRGLDKDGIGEACNGEDVQSGFESGEWKRWPKPLYEAVLWAIAEYEQLPLYIYDSQPENGGLRTYDDMVRIINMHRGSVAQENDHLIIAIDYAQLVHDTYRIFEDLQKFSNTCLATATGMNSTVIALTQFNRETNKMNARKEDTGDVMGTRGGADIEQDVHNYFEIIYDVEKNGDDKLEVRHRRARRGKSSRNRRQMFNIHPASGLILLTTHRSLTEYVSLARVLMLSQQ